MTVAAVAAGPVPVVLYAPMKAFVASRIVRENIVVVMVAVGCVALVNPENRV